MRETSAGRRQTSIASFFGLFAASVVCLVGGALFAVSVEGAFRLLLAGAGFAAYLFFFSRGLREIPFPQVMLEGDPDPERQRAADAGPISRRKGHLAAA